MMVALKVMAYFKISLSTRNWDRAIKKATSRVADKREFRDNDTTCSDYR